MKREIERTVEEMIVSRNTILPILRIGFGGGGQAFFIKMNFYIRFPIRFTICDKDTWCCEIATIFWSHFYLIPLPRLKNINKMPDRRIVSADAEEEISWFSRSMFFGSRRAVTRRLTDLDTANITLWQKRTRQSSVHSHVEIVKVSTLERPKNESSNFYNRQVDIFVACWEHVVLADSLLHKS